MLASWIKSVMLYELLNSLAGLILGSTKVVTLRGSWPRRILPCLGGMRQEVSLGVRLI